MEATKNQNHYQQFTAVKYSMRAKILMLLLTNLPRAMDMVMGMSTAIQLASQSTMSLNQSIINPNQSIMSHNQSTTSQSQSIVSQKRSTIDQSTIIQAMSTTATQMNHTEMFRQVTSGIKLTISMNGIQSGIKSIMSIGSRRKLNSWSLSRLSENHLLT